MAAPAVEDAVRLSCTCSEMKEQLKALWLAMESVVVGDRKGWTKAAEIQWPAECASARAVLSDGEMAVPSLRRLQQATHGMQVASGVSKSTARATVERVGRLEARREPFESLAGVSGGAQQTGLEPQGGEEPVGERIISVMSELTRKATQDIAEIVNDTVGETLGSVIDSIGMMNANAMAFQSRQHLRHNEVLGGLEELSAVSGRLGGMQAQIELVSGMVDELAVSVAGITDGQAHAANGIMRLDAEVHGMRADLAEKSEVERLSRAFGSHCDGIASDGGVVHRGELDRALSKKQDELVIVQADAKRPAVRWDSDGTQPSVGAAMGRSRLVVEGVELVRGKQLNRVVARLMASQMTAISVCDGITSDARLATAALHQGISDAVATRLQPYILYGVGAMEGSRADVALARGAGTERGLRDYIERSSVGGSVSKLGAVLRKGMQSDKASFMNQVLALPMEVAVGSGALVSVDGLLAIQ